MILLEDNGSFIVTWKTLFIPIIKSKWPLMLFSYFINSVLDNLLYVRMAEWSKAPDSRFNPSFMIRRHENSGPLMRAGVQIPFLTNPFFRFPHTEISDIMLLIFFYVTKNN